MSIPAAIQRLFSFTAFQQAQGDDSFPGTELDVELDQTNNAVDALISAFKAVIRADGKLANGLVTRNALAADVSLGLGYSRPWDVTAPYLPGEAVTRGYGLYQALQISTGLDPATSSAAWELIADLSQAVVVAANGVQTAAIADGAVTGPKLAPGAVGSAALADGGVTRGKLAANAGLVPVGARMDFAGINLPAGWLFEAGQAIPRNAYPDLFAALTLTVTADVTIGSGAIANVSRSIQGLGLRAAIVEGPGIPLGSRLVTDADGQLAINGVCTGTAAGVTLRFLPYGQGDGNTTFNVPDSRGRASFGRDDMLVSPTFPGAGRLVSVFDGTSLQAAAHDAGNGTERQVIGVNNLPAVGPDLTVEVQYPSHQYVKNAGVVTWQAGGGTDALNGLANAQTVPPGPLEHDVVWSNPNGGVGLPILPPLSVSNKIIFAGV